MHRMSRRALPLALAALLALSACSGIKKEASYPTRQQGTDKILYSDQKRDTIWGEGESLSSKLFGKDDDKTAGGSGIGVNSFLWRAALDTVSFMPVASADPFGGVILTDWYSPADTPADRFKVNVYILDRQLRADALKVSVFRQQRDNAGTWRDSTTGTDTVTQLEDTILTRARQLRISQKAE